METLGYYRNILKIEIMFLYLYSNGNNNIQQMKVFLGTRDIRKKIQSN